MNALEKIGLVRLEQEIREAYVRLQDSEQGRQEHLRILTKGSLTRALETLKALKENNNTDD